MKIKVKILKIEPVTHDVKRFIVEKPENYKFIPGQATRVSIDSPSWQDEDRPFTFTSLVDDPHLEFTIKGYPSHKGVTEKLHALSPGDSLIIRKVFGAIKYKGRGVFIAGGAGITPFIAILRQLRKDNMISGNRLIFSNKTKEDIILEDELKEMFIEKPDDLMLTLTEEKSQDYKNGMIDENFLKKYIDDFNQNFYLCGPPGMVEQLTKNLKRLGANIDSVVFEGK